MASIEFLQERIAKAEETITKKQNTIIKKEAQIQKKLDKLSQLGIEYDGNKLYTNELIDLGFDSNTANDIYWLECDVESLRDDIRRGQRDIDDKQKSLDDYRQKLQAEIEKANSRNIQVILDFLELWKERVTYYYHRSFEQFLVEREEWYNVSSDHCDWRNTVGWEVRSENPEEYRRIENEYESKRTAFYERWNFILPYVESRNTFNDAKLQKILDEEANAKYDFIIERTNAIVGTITDATNLRIGDKGDLNGIIIGDRGTAKVETIGAGGYNIQCFHYRTLINRVR